MFYGKGGKVTETNDGLCCGNESLCEGTNGGCKHRAGENAHIEVQTDSKAANKHEPGCVTSWLIAGSGDHVPKQLCVLAGSGEPLVSLGSKDVDGNGVRGKGDGGFVGARCGGPENNETRSGNIVLAKHFDSLRERGDHGGDPGFALGLFNE